MTAINSISGFMKELETNLASEVQEILGETAEVRQEIELFPMENYIDLRNKTVGRDTNWRIRLNSVHSRSQRRKAG